MTTIITLVILVSLGIVLVDGECQTNGGPIDNCCCLGYNNNNYNVKSSGVYTINNFCGVKDSNTRVYCDTTSGGGGWTIIERRQDESVDFTNRDWVEYEDGFGSLDGEFWLGLRSIHCYTSHANWELRIDYQLSNGTKSYLHYKQFSVGPAEDQYRLTISRSDSVGLSDPFNDNGHYHGLNNMNFTSRDRDNDLSVDNCAIWDNNGGWWYKRCSLIRAHSYYNAKNAIYLNSQGLALPFMEMKIRPLNCKNR
ncbi:fibrinogen C domain-containing protein 1-B-like [Dysidea avara]|uniref:fibrinogen C domain-containing protein 1-B-like n=1 Tax=Dysidea avara TaxID=196820 RepID=UPI00331ECE5B